MDEEKVGIYTNSRRSLRIVGFAYIAFRSHEQYWLGANRFAHGDMLSLKLNIQNEGMRGVVKRDAQKDLSVRYTGSWSRMGREWRKDGL
jgi:hypothetical protein